MKYVDRRSEAGRPPEFVVEDYSKRRAMVLLCPRHYVTRREYKTGSMFAVKVSCAKGAAFNTYQCVVAAADGSGSPGLGGPHIELGAFRPSRGGRCG
jgi:hypothetical protein